MSYDQYPHRDGGPGPRPPWGGVEPWDSRLVRRVSLAFTLGMLLLGLGLNVATTAARAVIGVRIGRVILRAWRRRR